MRGVTQKADLQPLLAKGLVAQEVAFPAPPRPKTDRQVRLLADAETIARVLPTLGHPSKQADVLARLAGQQLSRQPQYGQFEMTTDELCAAVGCTPAPVKALAERGWVSITPGASRKESSQVRLILAPEAVTDALVELRGAQRHKAVLEALRRHDGPAWIGWVYGETGATLDTLRDLEAAGLVTVAEEMIWRDPLAGRQFVLDQPPALTEDQEQVWAAVERADRPKQASTPGDRQVGFSDPAARRHGFGQDGDLPARDRRDTRARAAGGGVGAGDCADAADDPPFRSALSGQSHDLAQ